MPTHRETFLWLILMPPVEGSSEEKIAIEPLNKKSSKKSPLCPKYCPKLMQYLFLLLVVGPLSETPFPGKVNSYIALEC